jgi:hypothetical protein
MHEGGFQVYKVPKIILINKFQIHFCSSPTPNTDIIRVNPTVQARTIDQLFKPGAIYDSLDVFCSL